jgi:hypothetical protein
MQSPLVILDQPGAHAYELAEKITTAALVTAKNNARLLKISRQKITGSWWIAGTADTLTASSHRNSRSMKPPSR